MTSVVRVVRTARFVRVQRRPAYDIHQVERLMERIVERVRAGRPIAGLVEDYDLPVQDLAEGYDPAQVDGLLQHVLQLDTTATPEIDSTPERAQAEREDLAVRHAQAATAAEELYALAQAREAEAAQVTRELRQVARDRARLAKSAARAARFGRDVEEVAPLQVATSLAAPVPRVLGKDPQAEPDQPDNEGAASHASGAMEESSWIVRLFDDRS